MGKLDWNKKSSQTWNNAWKSENVGNSLGSLTNGITGVVSAGVQNSQIADTTAEESYIDQVANTQFSSGSFDNLLESFDFNSLARTNYTGKELRGLTAGQMAGNTLQGVASGATAGAQIGGPWGAVIGGVVGLGSGLIGIGTGNAKARTKAAQLNASANESNQQYLNNYTNAVSNTQNTMFNNSLLNIGAYGGPLFNHSENFDNGVIFIDEGGTHERNPLGGVPVGVDQEGTPNLVEEGEVIWNDYVFSNRLKPTKKQLENAGYGDKYQDLTFAKMVERIQDPERPNDTISQDSLNDFMSDLIRMQEEVRAKKVKANVGNTFKRGGKKKTPEQIAMSLFADQNFITPFMEDILSGIEIEESPINIEEEPFNKLSYSRDIDFMDSRDPKEIEYSDKAIQEETDYLNSIAEKEAEKIRTKSNDAILQLDKQQRLNRINNAYNSIIEPIKTNDEYSINNSLLRYASPLVNFGTFLSNLKQPDYSNADRIDKTAQQIPGGSFTPLGDYINLEPLDRNYYLNPLLATSRSNARNIQNQGLNAGQTIAGLLANNYNTQRNIGTTLMQMDQENMNRRLQEATFNRGTNQLNSQMGLQVLAMDQQRANNILNATMQAANMRNSLDAMRSQALNASLSGIAEDLGGIGRESSDREMIKYLADRGVIKVANGGLLTKRKRRIR